MSATVLLLAAVWLPGADPAPVVTSMPPLMGRISLGPLTSACNRVPMNYSTREPPVAAPADGGAGANPAESAHFGTSGVPGAAAAVAKLTVSLPRGAQLFVDDRPVDGAAGTTTFSTPPLVVGGTYSYQVRAELVRNGETVSDSVRVMVQPGQESWVSFPQLESGTARSSRADSSRLALMPMLAYLGTPVPAQVPDTKSQPKDVPVRASLGAIVLSGGLATSADSGPCPHWSQGDVLPAVASDAMVADAARAAPRSGSTAPAVQPMAYRQAAARPAATAGAKLVVQLAPGTRLFIDDRPVEAGGPEATFTTPPLEAGSASYYDLRAELVRGGQVVAESVRVVVRPGEVSWVSFPLLQTPPTGGRSSPRGR